MEPIKLQAYLHRGQLVFQLLSAVGFFLGAIALKWLFLHYHVPDPLYQILLVCGLLIALVLILTQAYLHHHVTTRSVVPLAWLTRELAALLPLHDRQETPAPSDEPITEKLLPILQRALGTPSRPQEMTSLVQTIEQLVHLLQKKSADEAMGRVAAQVAHDMRSPLAVIRTLVHHGATHSDTQDQGTRQRVVLQACEKLSLLADDLCALAKAKHVQCVQSNIVPVVQSALSEIRAGNARADVELRYVGPEEAWIAIDAPKFQRVLANLVTNAVQAMSAVSHGTVTVELLAEEEGQVTMRVRDTGTGIPAELLPKLFEKYFTTKGEKGNGLGLAYCKEVIEAHRGQLSVNSILGQGTVFTIALPAHCPE